MIVIIIIIITTTTAVLALLSSGGALFPDRITRATNTTWDATLVVSQDLSGSTLLTSVPASSSGYVLAQVLLEDSVSPGTLLCVSQFQARAFDDTVISMDAIAIDDGCQWASSPMPQLSGSSNSPPTVYAATTPGSPSGNLFALRVAANVPIGSAFVSFGMPQSGLEMVKIEAVSEGE